MYPPCWLGIRVYEVPAPAGRDWAYWSCSISAERVRMACRVVNSVPAVSMTSGPQRGGQGQYRQGRGPYRWGGLRMEANKTAQDMNVKVPLIILMMLIATMAHTEREVLI